MGIMLAMVVIIVIVVVVIVFSMRGQQKVGNNQQPQQMATIVEINSYQKLFDNVLNICELELKKFCEEQQFDDKFQITSSNNYFCIAKDFGKTPIIYVYYENLYYDFNNHEITKQKSSLVETNLKEVRIDFVKANSAYPMFLKLENVFNPKYIEQNFDNCTYNIIKEIRDHCDEAKKEWIKYSNLRWQANNIELKEQRLWEVSEYETNFRNKIESFIRGNEFKAFIDNFAGGKKDKFNINKFNLQYHVNLSELFTYSKSEDHENLSLYHLDCVLFYETYPLLVFEIDGKQHDTDVKQILKDKFKDLCLKNNNVEIVRIKTESMNEEYKNDIFNKIASTCPSCYGTLEIRTRNDNGDPFIGCENFPECNYTRNVDKK